MPSSSIITICATHNRLANNLNTWYSLATGPWHVWRGPRRRGIWDHATGSLAGAGKRGGATFALLHTTPGIWSCPGSRFLVLHPTFLAGWLFWCPAHGN